MMIRHAFALLAAIAAATHCTSIGAQPKAGLEQLKTVASVATNGLEGLDVDRNGVMYVTDASALTVHRITPTGIVSEFAKLQVTPQVVLLNGDGAVITAQRRAPDFSVLTPRDLSAQVMGALGPVVLVLDRRGKLLRTLAGPPGSFFNGMDRLGGDYLIADSTAGTIWRYDVRRQRIVQWLHDDALLAPGGGFPGANGLKVVNGRVYVANTATSVIYRIDTRRDRAAGALTAIAHPQHPDDFAVAPDGTLYVPSDGDVLRIAPGGAPEILAQGCTGCDAALLTDQGHSLLLVTHGFGPTAGEGHVFRLALTGTRAAHEPVAHEAETTDTAACERTCLRHVLDRYLEAMFGHDPGAAQLADGARATENAAPLANGSGIWRTATGYGAVQRRYLDTGSGQAAYYGLLQEGTEPVIVSLRLKIERRRVREAEWTIARKSDGALFSPEGLIAHPPPPDDPIPPADRSSRTQLIAAADAYFEGLQRHDGSAIPHIDGCERIENGVQVTHRPNNTPLGPVPGSPVRATPVPVQSPSQSSAQSSAPTPGAAAEGRSGDCVAGLDQFAIAATSHRRYPVVDEEAGVVVGMTLFQRPPGSSLKRNLLTEYFFGRQGRIAAIYAAMFYLDPNAADTPGWD